MGSLWGGGAARSFARTMAASADSAGGSPSASSATIPSASILARSGCPPNPSMPMAKGWASMPGPPPHADSVRWVYIWGRDSFVGWERVRFPGRPRIQSTTVRRGVFWSGGPGQPLPPSKHT
jgi:hypothetical protein